MIELVGKTKSDAQQLRASLYNSYLTLGYYDKTSADWLNAMTLVDSYCTKAGINRADYVFDFWACAVFTLAEHSGGAMLAYRKSLGLK